MLLLTESTPPAGRGAWGGRPLTVCGEVSTFVERERRFEGAALFEAALLGRMWGAATPLAHPPLAAGVRIMAVVSVACGRRRYLEFV
eukprot:305622-Prorocentrum_minimum.AAC.1